MIVIKHTGVCAIKLFFGDLTLEEALMESEKDIRYSWYGTKLFKTKGGKREE